MKLKLSNITNRYSKIHINSTTLFYDGNFINTYLIETKAIPDEQLFVSITLYNEPYGSDIKNLDSKYNIANADTTNYTFEY